MMKRTTIIAMALMALVLPTSCAYGQAQPKTPPVFSEIGAYGPAQFNMDLNRYDAALSSGNLDQAKLIRDAVVYRVKGSIDVPYGPFKTTLYLGNAKKNTIFDLAEDVALAAIGITRDVRTKDIVTTILQGGKSVRKSYDANFLKGQTLWMVITAMDAGRLKVFTEIEGNLQSDVLTYSLYQAISDEVLYAQAGTIEGGLQGLGDQAGTALQAARSEAVAARAVRASAAQQHATGAPPKPKCPCQ